MLNVFIGAAALGLLWAIFTVGVFITFRVLNIPDLTMEGSTVLGAATAAVALASGLNPYISLALAALAGMAAGAVTGLLHTKLKIPALLAGILSMIALYSVNIRVMRNSANIPLLRLKTVFTPLIERGFTRNIAVIINGSCFVAAVIAVAYWFFSTEIGNAVRATGNNANMAKAQGINTDTTIIMGLALGNCLIGLSGGLIAQYLGFSDVHMGQGSIVIGLASLIIGEVLFGKAGFLRSLIANIVGAVSYRFVIALVLEAGMRATDLKLFTAITVVIALCLPNIKSALEARLKRRERRAPNA
jgi:putative ABC transport system permease protein